MSARMLDVLERLQHAHYAASAELQAAVDSGVSDDEIERIFEVYLSKLEDCHQFVADALANARSPRPVGSWPGLPSLSDGDIRQSLASVAGRVSPLLDSDECCRMAMMRFLLAARDLLADPVEIEKLRDLMKRSLEILYFNPPEILMPATPESLN